MNGLRAISKANEGRSTGAGANAAAVDRREAAMANFMVTVKGSRVVWSKETMNEWSVYYSRMANADDFCD